MKASPLWFRTPRNFTVLKLWAAAQVEDSKEGSARCRGAETDSSPREKQARTKNNGKAVATAQARHLLSLKLEAAPHPSDDFIKGEGF